MAWLERQLKCLMLVTGVLTCTMIYAAIGYWGVGLLLGVVLAFGTPLRGIGIWIGLATGLGVVASLMLWRWVHRDRLGLVTAVPKDVQEAFAS